MALCLLIGFLARLAPEGLTIPTTVMLLPVLLDLTAVVAPPSLTVLAVEEFVSISSLLPFPIFVWNPLHCNAHMETLSFGLQMLK
jgi:hypothetical protein